MKNSVGPVFISRENNFLIVPNSSIPKNKNVFMFPPGGSFYWIIIKNQCKLLAMLSTIFLIIFYVFSLLLHKFLSLPNRKALILKTSFYSIVYELLLIHKFKFVRLDSSSDFCVYCMKSGQFEPKTTSDSYVLFFQ